MRKVQMSSESTKGLFSVVVKPLAALTVGEEAMTRSCLRGALERRLWKDRRHLCVKVRVRLACYCNGNTFNKSPLQWEFGQPLEAWPAAREQRDAWWEDASVSRRPDGKDHQHTVTEVMGQQHAGPECSSSVLPRQ